MATKKSVRKSSAPVVGIVTEGDSEVLALPGIYPQLSSRTGASFLKPVRVAVDPCAPPPVIARGCSDRIRLAFARGAKTVIVLLDREDATQSAAARAAELEVVLSQDFGNSVRVVVKDRTFEHWLISACGAFGAHPAKYPNADKVKAGFTSGRADHCSDAEKVINRAMVKGSYEKTRDAPEILKSASVSEMAAHSRSFRRLLAVCGDKAYADGSCASAEK